MIILYISVHMCIVRKLSYNTKYDGILEYAHVHNAYPHHILVQVFRYARGMSVEHWMFSERMARQEEFTNRIRDLERRKSNRWIPKKHV